jgi:hypothetical protein
MHSKQQAPARDPMPKREEQAQPTARGGRAGTSAAAEGLRIGDTASRTRTVTARDIELFTELTGDRVLCRRHCAGGHGRGHPPWPTGGFPLLPGFPLEPSGRSRQAGTPGGRPAMRGPP